MQILQEQISVHAVVRGKNFLSIVYINSSMLYLQQPAACCLPAIHPGKRFNADRMKLARSQGFL